MDIKERKINLIIYNTFFIFIIIFLFFHTFLITGLRQKYKTLAQNNRLLIYDIPPLRGIIQANDGTPLTINKPIYILEIKNIKGIKELLNNNLTDLYQRAQEQIQKPLTDTIINDSQPNKPNKSLFPLYIYNLSEKQANQIKVINDNNLKVFLSTMRNYKYPYEFAHVLGYTSIVFKEDLDNDPTLHPNDIIGRTGLEKQYDKELRGQHGQKVVEINALGQIVNTLKERSKPSIPGANIKTNLSIKMQKELYLSLARVISKYHIKGGAGIILEVNTGAIKAIVSYPSFNPNSFAKGISQKEYHNLVNNKQLPLFNRATMAQAPPGSTFKTMVAVSALQENAINESTQFYSSGTITLPGGTPFQEYHKHVYGWLTVRDALMVSSNIFFCKTALKLGINKLDYYLKFFGIGTPTGVDLPSEASGRMPSIKNKIWLAQHGATWLDPVWYPEGDACNSAIGQGITLVTPIQLANVAATIANKGIVYKPFIVKEIQAPNYTKEIKPTVINKVPADKHVFTVVQQGMYMSVHGPRSIIPNLRNVPITVAAKTGTAEFGIKTKDGYLTTHAWVMGFYPYNNPKYAFAIFLEAGGSSLHAAEVMQNFLNNYYK